MKRFLMLLAFVLAFNSGAAVFGASTNSVTKIQHVKNETSLASASYEIIPHSEVETGSSIIITFTNATVFSQDIIDGTSSDTKAIGYKEGGYQYNVNGITWDGSKSFSEVVPYTSSNELPYRIRRINEIQIEVFLINLPKIYAGNSLERVNGSLGEPYYLIPLVVYSDSETTANVEVSIDSNGTSISGTGSTNINNSLATSTTETSTEATTAETTTEITTENNDNNENNKLTNKVEVQIGSNEIKVNYEAVTIDAPAYIQEDSSSTMIPLRAVSQGVVGNSDCVEWDAETKTAIIKYNGNTVKFTAGSNIMYINEKESVMANNVSAEIKNSRMFVPFRALGEALGASVSWDAETKTAYFN